MFHKNCFSQRYFCHFKEKNQLGLIQRSGLTTRLDNFYHSLYSPCVINKVLNTSDVHSVVENSYNQRYICTPEPRATVNININTPVNVESVCHSENLAKKPLFFRLDQTLDISTISFDEREPMLILVNIPVSPKFIFAAMKIGATFIRGRRLCKSDEYIFK